MEVVWTIELDGQDTGKPIHGISLDAAQAEALQQAESARAVRIRLYGDPIGAGHRAIYEHNSDGWKKRQ